jgi:hypothetical protein
MKLAHKGFLITKANIFVDKINWKLSNSQKAILLNIFKLHEINTLDDLLVFCLTEKINKPFKHYGNENKLFGNIQKREIKNCAECWFKYFSGETLEQYEKRIKQLDDLRKDKK